MLGNDFLNEYKVRGEELLSLINANVTVSDRFDGLFIEKIGETLSSCGASKVFVVSGFPFDRQLFDPLFEKLGAEALYYKDFSPNPVIEEIERGVEAFNGFGADHIIAVGGGSAIDTAKCIRKFCGKEDLILSVFPTTAGTGSDATKFAVYYKDGVKQSLEAEDLIPDRVFLCGDLIRSLPLYQKKCTFLDAFCQCCESAFGVRRTGESLELAFAGIRAMSLIKEVYLSAADLKEVDRELSDKGLMSIFTYALLCANCSGRAINITRTAGPHAMSYKLSSMKKIPHGHAVAVCFRICFGRLCEALNNGFDDEGVLSEISNLSFGVLPQQLEGAFKEFLDSIGIEDPFVTPDEAEILASSVNEQRLKNNPLIFSHDELKEMYLMLVR